MKVILSAVLTLFSIPSIAFDKSLTNDRGFVTCYETKSDIYFFNWDPFVKTKLRAVSYFKIEDYVSATGHFIKSCNDQQYLMAVPSEILRPLHEIQNILPTTVLSSLDQIANGGQLFRFEKSAAEYINNRSDQYSPDRPEVLSGLRYQTGDTFATEVMNEFIQKVVPRGTSCEDLIGTCDFYLCQEKLNPCGLDGYNLSFGYKYCSGSKFELVNQMKTPTGRLWVSSVFQCLQRKSLVNSATRTRNNCQAIAGDSFDSHADCYVRAGFCDLKGSELLSIFSLIKKEILSPQTINQSVEILKKCSSHL